MGQARLIDPQGFSEPVPKPPDPENRSPAATGIANGADVESGLAGASEVNIYHVPSGLGQAALALARDGWHVFPCRRADKAPFLPCDRDEQGGRPIPNTGGLYKASADARQITAWWSRWPDAMIAVRTGPESGLWALDCDVDEGNGLNGLLALGELEEAHGALPMTIRSRTPRGGMHYLFKWTDGVRNSSGKVAPGIDVRGEGGYIIVPPSTRTDGSPYRWEDPPGLFEAAEAPAWLLDLVQRRPALGAAHDQNFLAHAARAALASSYGYGETALDEECRAVASAPEGSRNDQVNCSAFNLSQLVAGGALDEAHVRSRLLDAASGLVDDDGLRSVIRTIDSGFRAGSKHPRSAPERPTEEGRAETPSPALPPALDAKPFVWRDPAMIEPRRWLYGHHLIRGFLSATVAPGGVGKSSLALVEALAMVTGRDLLGHKPAGKLRVWYWNGEDPEEELHRRIAAICLHYGITAEEIGDRLFVNSGRDTEIVMATETKTGVVIAEPVAAAVLATVEKNRIDVMMVDPFVASHEVSENDNNKINAVARRWSRIADAAGSAVELVHHARKVAPGQAEIAVEDARGASALIAAVRSARTLNVMTKDEAEKAGVKQPRLHFRVDNGKANLAPPPEATTWHKLIGVPLGNARDDRPEDYVGVVTAWTWPNPFDDVTTRDLRAVQSRIAEGEWRADPQSDAWAGKAVAEVLRLDPSDKAVEAKAKGLLKVWTDTGMLKVVEKPDHKRNLRKFVEVAQWAND